MNFFMLFILFIMSGCNLTTGSGSQNNNNNLEQIEETIYDNYNDNEPDNTNIEDNNELTTVNNNDTNNNLDADDKFIASLKTMDKSKLESSLTSFVFNQLKSIEPDKKLAKIKKILDSDIILNIYHNDPTKFNHFYDKCKYYLLLKDKEEFNDYVKNILLKDDSVKVFLDKDYSTAFASLPENLKENNELQAKYVSYLISNDQINKTVENIVNSTEQGMYKNEKLYTLYKNGAQEYVVNFFSNDYIDKLDQNQLLEVANILGYQQKTSAIRDSTLFAVNDNNIPVPYVEHRYNLFKALNPSQIIFELYDKILGKFYNFENFVQKLLEKSTDKNKDIDFLLNHPDSQLSQKQKNYLQTMKNT